jgi:hypothetical protein
VNWKNLVVRQQHGRPGEFGLSLEDAMGVTYAWGELTRAKTLDLIRQLNEASEAGAPWGKFERAR